MSGRTLSKLALASLLILPLGTAGCSQGQSPTEPSLMEGATPSASASATQDGKRRGADDPAGHVRQGRGADDPAGDDRGRRRRGRGADDPAGDDQGRRGRGRGNDDRPQAGQEFSGTVVAVDLGAGTLTLSGGTTVTVNGQTQWNARGDLRSLSAVNGALQAGDRPRAEGRGTRQAGGNILAQSLKVEVDD